MAETYQIEMNLEQLERLLKNLPASANRFVTSISCLLGSGSPEGWLCAKMILLALDKIADLNTSLG